MIDYFDFQSDVLFAEVQAISSYLSGADFSIFEKIDPTVSDVKNYLRIIKLFAVSGMKQDMVEELTGSYCLSPIKAELLPDKMINDEGIEL